MLKYSNKRVINSDDWDELVIETYGKPYCFQQQNDCQPRGNFDITIPSDINEEEHMNDNIPEVINGDIMGVKFATWLAADPDKPICEERKSFNTELFWERNFYPSIHTLANDLYNKGLVEAGEYTINIDW